MEAMPHNIHVRWMIRRDLCDVVDIENEAFEFPWSEDEFIRCLRQRNCIGMLAEDTTTKRILGFMVYELGKTKLHVLDFAIRKECRRQGVGRALLEKLKAKLWPGRRTRIMLEVRETNLDGQLFWQSQGFKAVSVLRDFYDDTDEDAYVMLFKLAGQLTTDEDAAADETCQGR